MKIGFVLYDYFPFGGLQEDCLATARMTRQRGHTVTIFTRTWTGPLPDGIEVVCLGKRGWRNTSSNEHFFNALAQALPSHTLDGVVAFSRIPGADIYFAADPCYLERTRAKSFSQKLSGRHRYYANLERRIFGRPDHPDTLVLTPKEIDSFAKHYPIDPNRFHLLPPGVRKIENPTAEQPKIRRAFRNELGTAHHAPVLLFVGSGFRIKGLDRALKAVAVNRTAAAQLELWIVGSGKKGPFQRLANQAGVPVRFFGGRTDVGHFYQSADALLHPAYSESAGKVLLEAVTYGLPVITTDTCGYAPHIVAARAGEVLTSPFAQDTLNATVGRFITDAALREEMAANALHYAETTDLYSCHRTAAEWIERIL